MKLRLRLENRLDVFFCTRRTSRVLTGWRSADGLQVL